MAKYVNADLLRKEIERRMKIYKESNYGISLRYQELEELLAFLDTLSEEPNKSLEEAALGNYYSGGYIPKNQELCEVALKTKEVQSFIAGAEWQKSQMLKDAEECELYWDGDFLAIDLNMVALGYSEKDKVKVIVLKDESK